MESQPIDEARITREGSQNKNPLVPHKLFTHLNYLTYNTYLINPLGATHCLDLLL